MPTIRVEQTVPADRATVFAVITDFENAASFTSGILRLDMLTPGPVMVGTRFRQTREMFGKEASEELEVVEFERPGYLALGAHSRGVDYRITYTLSDDEGATRIVCEFTATPVTFAARLMAGMSGLFEEHARKIVAADLADASAEAERRRPV